MTAWSHLRRIVARNGARLVVAALLLAGVVWLYSQVDVKALHEQAGQLDGITVFVLLTLLPLVGFPVSVLHVVAGVRFGTQLGFVLVMASIGLQLLASWGLVHLFRASFSRRFAALRARLPQGTHGPVALFTMLLPGVPYFAKNYVLPLVGLPLGTYLAWCWPLHALRSAMGVVLGDHSDELTGWKVAGFVAYGLVIAAGCAWSFRRLQALAANPPPAEGDRTPAG